MGLDNPVHLAFLLLVVLLVFGAKRLPEIGRSLGAGLRGFKESINTEPTATHGDLAPTLNALPAEVSESSPEYARANPAE